MKHRQQKSPAAATTEQNDFSFIRIHYSNDLVKFTYTDYDIVEEAKRHPERINGIIADAQEGNCSAWLLQRLYDVQYDYYGRE